MQIYEYFFLQVEIQQRSEQREKSISNYRVQQLLGRNPLEAGKIIKGAGLHIPLSYSINADYSQGVESRSKVKGTEKAGNNRLVDSILPGAAYIAGDSRLFRIL